MGEMENDASVVADAENQLKGLGPEIAKLEIETLLSGEADSNDSFLEVHAGAGGTESQDWASMLMRMYTRWAEKQGYKVEIIELHDGEEAGIKSPR
jgi:peptide chain release factor 2